MNIHHSYLEEYHANNTKHIHTMWQITLFLSIAYNDKETVKKV